MKEQQKTYPTPLFTDNGINWNWWWYKTEEEASICAEAMRTGWNNVHGCRARAYTIGEGEHGIAKGLWGLKFHQFNYPRVVDQDYDKESEYKKMLSEQEGNGNDNDN